MKKSKGKVTEFLAIFSMVIGTVVGGGIYMKNNSLLKDVQNPLVSLSLWAIVGVACLLSIFVYMEISTSTINNGNGTLGNWSKLFINRKIASAIALFYMTVYLPCQESFFVGSFIMYMFEAIGYPISIQNQLIIYVFFGIVLMISFATLHILAPKFGKNIQVFGTIFKFIPLAIALIAGFFLVTSESAIHGNDQWSNNTFVTTTFTGGFSSILFSFDGYIYIANSQKSAKNKDVVPKALSFAMIFCFVFYIVISISLLFGSKDGTIQNLFENLILKISKTKNSAKIAKIISSSILMIISLISINVYTMIGVVNIESDVEAGLLYINYDNKEISRKKASLFHLIPTIIIYLLTIVLSIVVPIGDYHGLSQLVNSSDNFSKWIAQPISLINEFSSAGAFVSFTFISLIMIFAIINRKTKKVEVEELKHTVPFAIISSTMMLMFVAIGSFSYILGNDILNGVKGAKWIGSDAMLFTMLLIFIIIALLVEFFVQEKKIKKYEENLLNNNIDIKTNKLNEKINK